MIFQLQINYVVLNFRILVKVHLLGKELMFSFELITVRVTFETTPILDLNFPQSLEKYRNW
jgi:hypothetical protein